MSKSRQARAGSLITLGAVLVAAALMLLVVGRGSDGSAQAQGLPAVGMTLGGPSTVEPGVPFVITVNADPAPAVDLGGFASEVVFGGLEWMERAACEDEVQVGRQDGLPLAVCLKPAGPIGQARHSIVTAVQATPLPALEPLSNGDVLVELDVQCPAEGTYSLLLTAASQQDPASAQFGAMYFDSSVNPLDVQTIGTQELDLDGDTVMNTRLIADTLDVTCAVAPEPPEEVSPPPELSPIQPAETGTGAGGYGGDGSGLWATIGALLAAAAAGLTIFGWRYARSRP